MATRELKRSRKLSLFFLLFVILGSVGIDQVTKVVAEEHLLDWSDQANLKRYHGRSIPIWSTGDRQQASAVRNPHVEFNLTYVRNQGAAWGALSDWEDHFRIPFFYGVTLLALVIILLYMRSTPYHHRLARFALALIMSGAIGNFLDRVRLGYVIDFLDVNWFIPLPFSQLHIDSFPNALSFFNVHWDLSYWQYDFPKFNWADSCITVGVTLLLIDMMILEGLRQRNQKPIG